MFIDSGHYPQVRLLEDNYELICREFESLHASHFQPWEAKYLYGDGWSVFGFYLLGRRSDKNCALCPETTRIIESAGLHFGAAFSRMKPGTVIKPHLDRNPGYYRCHLGVQIPEGDLGFRTGGETRRWEVGKTLIFDGRKYHQAWNRTEEDRVVLIVDLPRKG